MQPTTTRKQTVYTALQWIITNYASTIVSLHSQHYSKSFDVTQTTANVSEMTWNRHMFTVGHPQRRTDTYFQRPWIILKVISAISNLCKSSMVKHTTFSCYDFIITVYEILVLVILTKMLYWDLQSAHILAIIWVSAIVTIKQLTANSDKKCQWPWVATFKGLSAILSLPMAKT